MTIKNGVYYPLGYSEDMSEGERMCIDGMDAHDAEDPDYREQVALERLDHIEAPVGVWNATAGPIPMTEMTDSHLKNAMRWLSRYGLLSTEKADEIRNEQESRAKRARKAKKARAASPSRSGES
jgi:hypothetical protein